MLVEGPRGPRSSRRPRWRVLLVPAAVALLLHAWLLGGDGPSVGMRDGASSATAAVQVRSVEPVPVAAAVAESPAQPVAPATPRPPTPTPTPARPRAADGATRVAAAAPEMKNTPTIRPAEAVTETPPATPVDAEIVKTVAAATAAADMPPPTYRTQMPPPATMQYDLRRGVLSGNGQLVWKPAGDRYELRLEGRVAGMHVLTETSTGSLDAHGLAPLRYTDMRIRRGVSAANFQRDKGKITYSGPAVEYPLPPGAQDRLSWMIQIAAVLNAEPQLAAAGERIAFFVSGARGDADLWVFRYVGTDTIATEGTSVQAVKFTREPRKPYDRMVEVWLAPTHHHLPVRAKLTTTADGEVFELLLRGIQPP